MCDCVCLPRKYEDSPHPDTRTIPPAAFYNVQRFLLGHNKRIYFAFFSRLIAVVILACVLCAVCTMPFTKRKVIYHQGRKYLHVLGTLKYVVRCKGGMYASVLLEREAGRITESTEQKGWCDLLRTMCNVTLSDRNMM